MKTHIWQQTIHTLQISIINCYDSILLSNSMTNFTPITYSSTQTNYMVRPILPKLSLLSRTSISFQRIISFQWFYSSFTNKFKQDAHFALNILNSQPSISHYYYMLSPWLESSLRTIACKRSSQRWRYASLQLAISFKNHFGPT